MYDALNVWVITSSMDKQNAKSVFVFYDKILRTPITEKQSVQRMILMPC